MKIEIKDLNVKVGDFQLKDINLSIEKATIYGLVGRNGSGKTTLMKTICDFIKPVSGRILFDGKEMNENIVEIKKHMQIVFDELYMNDYLIVKKLIKVYQNLEYDFSESSFRKYLSEFGLAEKQLIKNFSKGETQKLLVGLALSLNPTLLILDEPTSGLDPISRNEILDIIKDYVIERDASVIISTHITSDLEKIVDYVAIIDNGKIILDERRDLLDDKYRLVSLDKEDNLVDKLIGKTEKINGYQGLIESQYLVDNNIGVIASIEDILNYLTKERTYD